jgi:transcriptional regulator with XRE-family HTH domain
MRYNASSKIKCEVVGMRVNKSGHRIKVARTMHRFTQNDLMARVQVAGGLHITKNMISRIERGERPVSDIELTLFAEALNVSTSWLLEETSTPDRL